MGLKIKCGRCGILKCNASLGELEERVKSSLAKPAGDTKTKELVNIE